MNTHQGVLGTSGAGKSHTMRHLMLRALGPWPVAVIVDLKPGGDRVWRGFGNHIGPDDLPCPLAFGPGGPAGPRGIWHVSAPEGLTRAEVARILAQLAAERSVIVILDDATTITDSAGGRGGMGLDGAVDRMMREGRANGLSVWLGLNSPTWAGRGGSKTLCGTYWIGHTASMESRDGFASIAGITGAARGALDPPEVSPKHWLYSTVDSETGMLVRAITRAPG
jgi:hypothetical protein